MNLGHMVKRILTPMLGLAWLPFTPACSSGSPHSSSLPAPLPRPPPHTVGSLTYSLCLSSHFGNLVYALIAPRLTVCLALSTLCKHHNSKSGPSAVGFSDTTQWSTRIWRSRLPLLPFLATVPPDPFVTVYTALKTCLIMVAVSGCPQNSCSPL